MALGSSATPEIEDYKSFVISWRYLERLPLLTIMTEDDQRHVLALDQIQELARAGAQLLLVVIQRPGLTIRGKKTLHDHGVDSQQHRAGLRQAHQHRLMSRCMPTGLEQRQAGQEFGISINQPVTQGRMIPVSTRQGKARMSAARQGIVFALDDEFRLRKGIVIAHVVHVEMGTDEDIDIVRTQTQSGELSDHIVFLRGWNRPGRQRDIWGESAINQDMLPSAGLDEIATQDHFQRAACSGYGRGS